MIKLKKFPRKLTCRCGGTFKATVFELCRESVECLVRLDNDDHVRSVKIDPTRGAAAAFGGLGTVPFLGFVCQCGATKIVMQGYHDLAAMDAKLQRCVETRDKVLP